MSRSFAALILLVTLALPATASAEFFEVWARGDAGYLTGDADLHYFQANDVGPEYGFAVGAQILVIDVFANVNFHPDGSMFNLLGLQYDLDLVPGDTVSLGPLAQTAYFFAPTGKDGELDDRGFIFRGGAFFEIAFSRFVAIGAEGTAGYALVTSDAEYGMVYQGSGYLKFKVGF